jgi:hypothetical protein
MSRIELIFTGFPSAAVDQCLSSPESGFHRAQDPMNFEFRAPMRSSLGDICAVSGVLLSAAQLAVALFQLRVGHASKGGTQPTIHIKGKSSAEITPSLTEAQIRDTIEKTL